ncbi:MAG TPA: VanZ family protein [Gillisia sp.]|nr:VanZ family protein [Gillisia sp.]
MAAKILLLLAVVYTILITTLSLVQLGKISVGNFSPTDKMMHVGAYFGLAILWFSYYLFKKEEQDQKQGFLKISALVVLFGILIEVLQGTLTDYREPDWADALANTIGVFIAYFIFVIFQKFLNRVKHHISSFL